MNEAELRLHLVWLQMNSCSWAYDDQCWLLTRLGGLQLAHASMKVHSSEHSRTLHRGATSGHFPEWV